MDDMHEWTDWTETKQAKSAIIQWHVTAEANLHSLGWFQLTERSKQTGNGQPQDTRRWYSHVKNANRGTSSWNQSRLYSSQLQIIESKTIRKGFQAVNPKSDKGDKWNGVRMRMNPCGNCLSLLKQWQIWYLRSWPTYGIVCWKSNEMRTSST